MCLCWKVGIFTAYRTCGQDFVSCSLLALLAFSMVFSKTDCKFQSHTCWESQQVCVEKQSTGARSPVMWPPNHKIKSNKRFWSNICQWMLLAWTLSLTCNNKLLAEGGLSSDFIKRTTFEVPDKVPAIPRPPFDESLSFCPKSPTPFATTEETAIVRKVVGTGHSEERSREAFLEYYSI